MNRRSFLKAAPAVVALPAVAFASVEAPEGFHRISVEEGDPGYIPYGMLRGDRKKVSIFLNGQKEPAVITANAREGWIKRHIRTPDGNYAHHRGKLLTEVVHGAVVIEISNKDTVK